VELCLDETFFYIDGRVKYRSQVMYTSGIIVRQGYKKSNNS